MADVKVLRMHKLQGDSKVKCFADILVDDILIRGVRLVAGSNGIFIGLPREKSKDETWHDVVDIVSADLKQKIFDTIKAHYELTPELAVVEETNEAKVEPVGN